MAKGTPHRAPLTENIIFLHLWIWNVEASGAAVLRGMYEVARECGAIKFSRACTIFIVVVVHIKMCVCVCVVSTVSRRVVARAQV